jgi:hypothetical protein
VGGRCPQPAYHVLTLHPTPHLKAWRCTRNGKYMHVWSQTAASAAPPSPILGCGVATRLALFNGLEVLACVWAYPDSQAGRQDRGVQNTTRGASSRAPLCALQASLLGPAAAAACPL